MLLLVPLVPLVLVVLAAAVVVPHRTVHSLVGLCPRSPSLCALPRRTSEIGQFYAERIDNIAMEEAPPLDAPGPAASAPPYPLPPAWQPHSDLANVLVQVPRHLLPDALLHMRHLPPLTVGDAEAPEEHSTGFAARLRLISRGPAPPAPDPDPCDSLPTPRLSSVDGGLDELHSSYLDPGPNNSPRDSLSSGASEGTASLGLGTRR